MTQTKVVALLILLLLVLVTVASAFYSVDEREKVIVVRFGQILRHDDPAGLHWKTPFVDDARYFDSRILTTEPAQPGTSAALGVLGAIFGMGAFVMQRGGQPERVPFLAGLSAGAVGYAVARVVLGF